MPPLHPSRVTEAGGRWRGTAEPTPQTAGPGQSSLPSAPGHAGARHQGQLGGSLCLDRNAAPGVAGAASVWPAPSVGVGVRLGSKVSALPRGQPRLGGRNVSEGQQLSATNCACTRVPAIVCPGGGSVGDPKSGRSGPGRPPEVSRAGPPASHSFAVPTAPRAGERTMASMRAFDGRLPLCLCLCVSWHLCLCESLAHSCFPTSFPSPRGAELGGPGSGNGTASCSHQGQ